MAADRIPQTEQARIEWARDHVTLWSGQGIATSIGLAAGQVASLNAAVTLAETRRAAQVAANTAKLAATEAKNVAIDSMDEQIGAAVATIDAFALASGNPDVYSTAGIPAPKAASPRQAPPQPELETPENLSGGIIRLAFKVVTGGGAQYLIQRRDTPLEGGPGDWFTIASVAQKTYDDQAVPFGLREVAYRVRASLSNGAASGWSESATFSFGTAGSQGGPLANKRIA